MHEVKKTWLWDEETLKRDDIQRVVPLDEIRADIAKQAAAGWFTYSVDEEKAEPGRFRALLRVMRRMFRK